MTNSPSLPGQQPDSPDGSPVVPAKSGAKPRRTGNRRVSAPAGSPRPGVGASPVIMVVGTGGMVVPAPTLPATAHREGNDAGPPALVETAPEEGNKPGDDGGTPAAQAAERQPGSTSEPTDESSGLSTESEPVGTGPTRAEPVGVEPAEPKEPGRGPAATLPTDADEDRGTPSEAAPARTASVEPAATAETKAIPGTEGEPPADTDQMKAPQKLDAGESAGQETGSKAPTAAAEPAKSVAEANGTAGSGTVSEARTPDEAAVAAAVAAGAGATANDEPGSGADTDSAAESDSKSTDESTTQAESKSKSDSAAESTDEPEAMKDGVTGAESQGDSAQTSAGDGDSAGDFAQDDAKVAIAAAVATGSTPLSRRQRRQAELGQPSGVEPAATPAPMAGTAASPVSPAPRATRGKGRSKSWLALRGFLMLLVIAVVVVGMGTVVADRGTQNGTTSATETHRALAWSETVALLGQARALGATTPDPATKAQLNSAAAALAAHSAALSDGMPASTATPASTASAATPAAAVTVAEFTRSLAENANHMLGYAATADGGLGRVFASAGTGELLQATSLAKIGGLPAPDAPTVSAGSPFAVAKASPCQDTAAPEPGANPGSALTAAAVAEQEAGYAYQVAASRLADPAFTRAVNLLAVHQQRLALLNGELARECLPQIAPVPGYALNPAFTATPEKALAGLEGQLAQVYGDLAALSSPATMDEPAPGTGTADPTSAAVPTAETATSPRTMAVAWLLGATLDRQSWGGTIDLLPGIAESGPATPAATPTAPTTP